MGNEVNNLESFSDARLTFDEIYNWCKHRPYFEANVFYHKIHFVDNNFSVWEGALPSNLSETDYERWWVKSSQLSEEG